MYDAIKHDNVSYGEIAAHVSAICTEMNAIWPLHASASEAVAVVLPKGWRQVAAVFAVLCSGRAYIPIEAERLTQQIALILKQACCTKAVVLNSTFREIWTQRATCRVHCARGGVI